MKIIGLIGPKGSGKDASYEILKDAKRVDGKISFAGPLKAICGEVFGLHFNLLNDPDLKEKEMKEPIVLTARHIRAIRNLCEDYVNPVTPDGQLLYRSNAISVVGLEGRQFKTPRELMQIIGTELIRDRIWKGWHRTAAFSEKALSKLKKTGTYAVTDVRFLDEHQFLQAKFGKAYEAYYVDRPEASEKLTASVAKGNAHQSETETQVLREMLKDSVIENYGDLDDLKNTVKAIQFHVNVDETEEATAKGSRFRYVPKE